MATWGDFFPGKGKKPKRDRAELEGARGRALRRKESLRVEPREGLEAPEHYAKQREKLARAQEDPADFLSALPQPTHREEMSQAQESLRDLSRRKAKRFIYEKTDDPPPPPPGVLPSVWNRFLITARVHGEQPYPTPGHNLGGPSMVQKPTPWPPWNPVAETIDIRRREMNRYLPEPEWNELVNPEKKL